MSPIFELIVSLERKALLVPSSILPAITNVMNCMTSYSSDVFSYLGQTIYSVNLNFLKSKTIQKIDAEHLNPFFSPPQARLPFLLKYVSKPLNSPEYVDFGDQTIFYVSGGEKKGAKFVFDLPNHPGFKLHKTIGIENIEEARAIKPLEMMQDFFDVNTLRNQLTDPRIDELDKQLVFHQLIAVHHEYRNLLLKTLDLSSPTSIYASKTGEWQIKKDSPKKITDDFNKMASDINRYFHFEKLYQINLLGVTPNRFDRNAVKALFTLSGDAATIKESVELPCFLSEDFHIRHQIIKNLMQKCYPNELADKLLKEDTKHTQQLIHYQFKMSLLEENFPKECPSEWTPGSTLNLLNIVDEQLRFGLDVQLYPKMPLEAIILKNWVHLNCKKSVYNELLKDEILLLSKTLLQDVPSKIDIQTSEKLSIEQVVEKHLSAKAHLTSEIYALLANDCSEEALYGLYERAVDLIKGIMSYLDLTLDLTLSTQKNDPWKSSGDHFYKTFAEGFLQEIENKMTNFEDDTHVSLENRLLFLNFQRKRGVELSQHDLLKTLHHHIKLT